MSQEAITLDALAADMKLVSSLSADQARAVLTQLGALTVAVAARVVVEPSAKEPALPQLIDVKALSEILGKSHDFIYSHAPSWPFCVRLSSRDLMFDVNKLNKWLAARTGSAK